MCFCVFKIFSSKKLSSKMVLVNLAKSVYLQISLMGQYVPVNIIIENNYKSYIDFTFFNSPYTFTIERWARRGLTRYLDLFHTHVPRDISLYGVRVEDSKGGIRYYENKSDIEVNVDGTVVIGPGAKAMTIDQEVNCVEQGCRDILTCLGQIGAIHQQSMLEYAVWFCGKHPNPGTYSEFITLVTCQSIEHNDFIAPVARWTLVEFNDKSMG